MLLNLMPNARISSRNCKDKNADRITRIFHIEITWQGTKLFSLWQKDEGAQPHCIYKVMLKAFLKRKIT